MADNKLKFSVAMTQGKTEGVAGDTVTDPRPLYQRMFTIFDSKTGAIEAMPVVAINCALQTPSQQGIKSWDQANQIPLLLAYKAGVAEYKGASKNRDFLLIGKRPGQGKGNPGNPGLMVDVTELDAFIEVLQDLREAVSVERINALRLENGLPAKPVAKVPPTVAAAKA